MQPDRNTTDGQPTDQAPALTSENEPSRQPVVTLVSEASPAPLVSNEMPSQTEEEPVRWRASEYIQHDKNPLWFIVFAIVIVGLMAVAIFVIKSITFAILIPVMAAALLVYSYRPPRMLDYTLSRQGLYINDHLYSFTEFKGFGVIHDGKEFSVMLVPTKRFKPGVSVYFPEEAGEAIVDMLGARLPMQELHLDIVDRIIHKLRI